MALDAGARLGPYEVLSALGAGGMGEVYKARDTRLDRTVAIKVLPKDVAGDPDLRARFEREARAVAALDHPHICGIYDVGSVDGTHYLVMPHLEGQTLAARLEKGPLPLDQALKIATEIADALDKAHRQGMVHRDVKPGNIMLTKTGSKLLDFGLAKLRPHPGPISLSELTRMAVPETAQGTILGTLHYMAPEQVEGKEADARSDIWALGAVVYEMVTGARPFPGDTPASVMGAILRDQPAPISDRVPSIPAWLDRVVSRCLAKDANDRWQSAADLRQALAWIADSSLAASRPVAAISGTGASLSKRERVIGLVAGSAIIASLAMVVPTLRYFRAAPAPTAAAELRLEVTTPSTTDPLSMALSPDGRRLTFVASDSGTPRLWLRPLDSATSQPLPGTEGASYPFWSPDSRAIGFGAEGKLKRIDIGGGQPQTLADASGYRGGSWSRDGTILFAVATAGLRRVAASGGENTAATRLAPRQSNHRFPQFLPDGQHFLFFSQGSNETQGVHLGVLDSPETTQLTTTDTAMADTAAAFLPPDTVLYVRRGALVERHLDLSAKALSDNAVTVADPVGWDGAIGAGAFSASATGTVAYRASGPGRRQLAWFDRTGRRTGLVGVPDANSMQYPELSNGDQRLAIDRTVLNNRDIYIVNFARDEPTRLTFDPFIDAAPIWSPDGTRIIFRSSRKGVYDLYEKSASLDGNEAPIYESAESKIPDTWSPDGKFLLFVNQDPQTGNDLWMLPLSDSQEPPRPRPFLQTPFSESHAAFSPDGRWVAYQSNEGGPMEVYVQPFPGPGGKRQISSAGGGSPRWRHDGRELFYLSPGASLMAVALRPDGSSALEPGTPVALFQTPLGSAVVGNVRPQYDVAADGRFLMNALVEETASPIIVILNRPRLR